MSIQWYPGHMAKARRAMAKAFPSQDVIIEVLDARMPYASSNPIVTALRKQKPCLKILSKADLADPAATKAWLQFLEAEANDPSSPRPSGRVIAITSSYDRLGETKSKIPELCKRLVPHATGPARPIRAMVVGIPNVGKSTLINQLAGRKVAKVGDEPAVTKSQQFVTLPNNIVLSDNPGLLWPNIEDERVGYRLAFGGAISEAALDYEAVASFGAEVLVARYPEALQARYRIDVLPSGGREMLAEIGRRRGCLKAGGTIDLHKAADVLIHDFRNGTLGRISLELPEDAIPAEVPPEGDEAAVEGGDGCEPLDAVEQADTTATQLSEAEPVAESERSES